MVTNNHEIARRCAYVISPWFKYAALNERPSKQAVIVQTKLCGILTIPLENDTLLHYDITLYACCELCTSGR
jgi:hypothetical protein